MRTLRMWLGLILLSALSIVILDFAGLLIPGKGLDGLGSYVTFALFAFLLIRWLRPNTLQYFSKPILGWKFIVASILMLNLIVVHLQDQEFKELSSSQWIRGALFLIAVAVAEEIFSRGVTFGALLHRGLPVAVIGSSALFGVMHINTYRDNFDPWQAYWHVISATSFGIFACSLMVLTRCIWMPITLHTFSNASLLFETAPTKAEEAFRVSTPFLAGVFHPLPIVLTFIIPALILFWLAANMPLHPRLQKVAVRWKLIEEEIA